MPQEIRIEISIIKPESMIQEIRIELNKKWRTIDLTNHEVEFISQESKREVTQVELTIQGMNQETKTDITQRDCKIQDMIQGTKTKVISQEIWIGAMGIMMDHRRVMIDLIITPEDITKKSMKVRGGEMLRALVIIGMGEVCRVTVEVGTMTSMTLEDLIIILIIIIIIEKIGPIIEEIVVIEIAVIMIGVGGGKSILTIGMSHVNPILLTQVDW